MQLFFDVGKTDDFDVDHRRVHVKKKFVPISQALNHSMTNAQQKARALDFLINFFEAAFHGDGALYFSREKNILRPEDFYSLRQSHTVHVKSLGLARRSQKNQNSEFAMQCDIPVGSISNLSLFICCSLLLQCKVLDNLLSFLSNKNSMSILPDEPSGLKSSYHKKYLDFTAALFSVAGLIVPLTLQYTFNTFVHHNSSQIMYQAFDLAQRTQLSSATLFTDSYKSIIYLLSGLGEEHSRHFNELADMPILGKNQFFPSKSDILDPWYQFCLALRRNFGNRESKENQDIYGILMPEVEGLTKYFQDTFIVLDVPTALTSFHSVLKQSLDCCNSIYFRTLAHSFQVHSQTVTLLPSHIRSSSLLEILSLMDQSRVFDDLAVPIGLDNKPDNEILVNLRLNKWDWQIIENLVSNPLLSRREELSTHSKTKLFLRKVLHFFHPNTNQFSILDSDYRYFFLIKILVNLLSCLTMYEKDTGQPFNCFISEVEAKRPSYISGVMNILKTHIENPQTLSPINYTVTKQHKEACAFHIYKMNIYLVTSLCSLSAFPRIDEWLEKENFYNLVLKLAAVPECGFLVFLITKSSSLHQERNKELVMEISKKGDPWFLKSILIQFSLLVQHGSFADKESTAMSEFPFARNLNWEFIVDLAILINKVVQKMPVTDSTHEEKKKNYLINLVTKILVSCINTMGDKVANRIYNASKMALEDFPNKSPLEDVVKTYSHEVVCAMLCKSAFLEMVKLNRPDIIDAVLGKINFTKDTGLKYLRAYRSFSKLSICNSMVPSAVLQLLKENQASFTNRSCILLPVLRLPNLILPNSKTPKLQFQYPIFLGKNFERSYNEYSFDDERNQPVCFWSSETNVPVNAPSAQMSYPSTIPSHNKNGGLSSFNAYNLSQLPFSIRLTIPNLLSVIIPMSSFEQLGPLVYDALESFTPFAPVSIFESSISEHYIDTFSNIKTRSAFVGFPYDVIKFCIDADNVCADCAALELQQANDLEAFFSAYVGSMGLGDDGVPQVNQKKTVAHKLGISLLKIPLLENDFVRVCLFDEKTGVVSRWYISSICTGSCRLAFELFAIEYMPDITPRVSPPLGDSLPECSLTPFAKTSEGCELLFEKKIFAQLCSLLNNEEHRLDAFWVIGTLLRRAETVNRLLDEQPEFEKCVWSIMKAIKDPLEALPVGDLEEGLQVLGGLHEEAWITLQRYLIKNSPKLSVIYHHLSLPGPPAGASGFPGKHKTKCMSLDLRELILSSISLRSRYVKLRPDIVTPCSACIQLLLAADGKYELAETSHNHSLLKTLDEIEVPLGLYSVYCAPGEHFYTVISGRTPIPNHKLNLTKFSPYDPVLSFSEDHYGVLEMITKLLNTAEASKFGSVVNKLKDFRKANPVLFYSAEMLQRTMMILSMYRFPALYWNTVMDLFAAALDRSSTFQLLDHLQILLKKAAFITTMSCIVIF
eukprot:GHVP01063401.1.p1 GENE.GHVP01063401.1~~GHVP01063401.1.p1  ORF type:complete len:1446 (+),score=221.02 GHVP01063401.1:1258-5595(+)